MKQNIISIFQQNVSKNPNKTALIVNHETHTYQELAQDIEKFSAWLLENGVGVGSHVVVILDNSYEFVLAMLATANIGAVLIPVSMTLKREALLKVLETTHTNIILTKEYLNKKMDLGVDVNLLLVDGVLKNYQGVAQLGEEKVDVQQDYILTMTSGSTGSPKPIVFTQETKINRSLLAARDLYDLGENECIIVASPLYHSMGQRLVLLPLLLGGTCVMLQKFNVKVWCETVEKYRITFTIAIASHLNILVRYLRKISYDISSLNAIVSSSSLLETKVKQECVEKFQCDFHECYGASEVGIVTNLMPIDCQTQLIGSVGHALPFVDMKIVDENKNEVKCGIIGEIIAKSKTAFSRYYNNEEQTKKSVIDGYFYTGDLGYVDEKGYLFLKGRKKEMIIVGGTNVYPSDIEAILLQGVGVKEAAVVGINDEYFGEVVVAVLAIDEEKFDLKKLKLLCIRNLADYQQPMAFEIVDALPKNALGKVMKHKLQKEFQEKDITKSLRKIFQ